LTEHRFNPSKRKYIDLVIGKWTKKGFEPRIAIEMKETGKKLKKPVSEISPNEVEGRVMRDIEKLKEAYPEDRIKKYVFFFFRMQFPREQYPKGISDPYKEKLKDIERKHKDVVFKWGPL
jgi:hypothetical protein